MCVRQEPNVEFCLVFITMLIKSLATEHFDVENENPFMK